METVTDVALDGDGTLNFFIARLKVSFFILIETVTEVALDGEGTLNLFHR